MFKAGSNLEIILAISLLLIIIVPGFLLHKSGKPYNTAIFTIHKLLTLVFAAFMAVIIFHFVKANEMGILLLSSCIIASLLLISLLVSGGMISAGKKEEMMKKIHKVSNLGFILSMALIFYKLLNN